MERKKEEEEKNVALGASPGVVRSRPFEIVTKAQRNRVRLRETAGEKERLSVEPRPWAGDSMGLIGWCPSPRGLALACRCRGAPWMVWVFQANGEVAVGDRDGVDSSYRYERTWLVEGV